MRLQYLLFLPLLVSLPVSLPVSLALAQDSVSPTTQSAAPQSAREQYAAPVFNANTRSVVLDVVVTDSNGQPVTGLTRQDFVIREDDAPQEARSFEAVAGGSGAAEAGPHTILLVDEMNTRFEDMAYTRYSVNKLLKRGQREARDGHGAGLLEQPTALYALSDSGLHVLEGYTRDPAAIETALDKHKAVLPWRLSHRNFYSALERINLSLGALQQIAIANMGTPGHKNIVWISPGFPIFSALQIGADGQKQLFDAIRRLSDQMLRARISIYSVDPRGVEGLTPPGAFISNDIAFAAYINGLSDASNAAFGDIAIQTLAVQTGGHAFYGRNDVDREIASSIHDGNTYYTLSYSPANHDFRGEFRKIKVSIIDRPGLKVQTRDGYYAIPDGQPINPKQRMQELVSSLYAPLEYTGVVIPVSYARITQTPSQVDIRMVVSTASLSWRPDNQGRLVSTVSVAAANQDKHGHWQESTAHEYSITLPEGVTPSTGRGSSVSLTIPYKPSDDLLRFVVRDDASGRIGSSQVKLAPPPGKS